MCPNNTKEKMTCLCGHERKWHPQGQGCFYNKGKSIIINFDDVNCPCKKFEAVNTPQTDTHITGGKAPQTKSHQVTADMSLGKVTNKTAEKTQDDET